MNDTKQIPCTCTTCPGAGCTCGCRPQATQPATQRSCACGNQCPCGPGCTCAKS